MEKKKMKIADVLIFAWTGARRVGYVIGDKLQKRRVESREWGLQDLDRKGDN